MARALVKEIKDTRKNYIINGDMRIAQRGTSFSAIANNAYSLDRWKYEKSGAMVHTVSQGTDVPTATQASYLFQNSYVATLTTPDTSIAAGEYCFFQQHVEGFNWANLAQKPFTLSFWVKATLPGIYCVAFLNADNSRTYVAEYTINATNTWEYKTISVAASPAAGNWNYLNGTGLRVCFILAAGSTFQGTANQWNSSLFLATSNQVNGVNTGATSFLVTGVMLNEGSSAASFRTFGGDFQNELSACQRYYEIVHQSANQSFGWITVTAGGATGGEGGVPWLVEKRTGPSVTTNIDLVRVGGGGNAISVFAMSVPSIRGLRFNITTTGLTTGQVYTIYNSGSPAGPGEFRADAEF